MPTVDRILIHRDDIAQRVRQMGERLAQDLQAEAAELRSKGHEPGPVVMVPVLTGAILFVADLVRAMPVTMSIKPVTVTSYPGTAMSSQGATIQQGLPTDLSGKRVVLVDDILDSGQTLGLLKRMLSAQRPQSIRLAVLLTKLGVQRVEDVRADYSCFDIGNEFVVGYGLDYDGTYRNMPDIAVLKP